MQTANSSGDSPRQCRAHSATLFPLAAFPALSLAGIKLSGDLAPFNQTRLLELGLLAYLTGSLLFKAENRSMGISMLLSLRQTSRLAFALFWALGALSCLFSTWPQHALLDWAHYLLLALATLGVAALTRWSPAAASLIVAGMAAGAAIAVVRFLFEIGIALATQEKTALWGWWAPYTNPRFFAQAAAWTLPLLAALPAVFPRASRPMQVLFTCTSAGMWMLLLWTGSRGALLGLIAATGLAAIVLGRDAGHAIKKLLLGFLLGSCAWIITRSITGWDLLEKGDSLSFARATSSGRDWLILNSLRLVHEHPWLGVGPNHFSAYNTAHTGILAAHPHNFILQIASEWGTPAVFLLSFLLVRFFTFQGLAIKAGLSRTVKPGDTLDLFLLLALCASALLGLVDGSLVMPLSEMLGVLVAGLLIGRNAVAGKSVPVRGRQTAAVVLIITIISAWLLLIQNIVKNPDCITYPVPAQRILIHGTGPDNPRFWLQGRVPVEAGCLEKGRYVEGRDTLLGRPG